MAPVLVRGIIRQASRTGAAGLRARLTTSLNPRTSSLALRALVPQFASYATAAKKATPAKKTATATKKTAATKAKPKTKAAAPKKKPAAKKKAAPKKKAAKKKPVAVKRKKPLSDEEKFKAKVRDARNAQLADAPQLRALNAYSIFVSKKLAGKTGDGNIVHQMAELGKAFKAMPPAEKQALQAEAEQSSNERKLQFQKWIESHTMEEIARANRARRFLIKHDKAYKHTSNLLTDHRVLKRPNSPFALYVKAERGTKGTSISDIAAQWKNVPESEKKAYEELAATEKKAYNTALLKQQG